DVLQLYCCYGGRRLKSSCARRDYGGRENSSSAYLRYGGRENSSSLTEQVRWTRELVICLLEVTDDERLVICFARRGGRV
ncbi:hypothetical protein AVEN_247025-1, partial [Araneus ventricosus]